MSRSTEWLRLNREPGRRYAAIDMGSNAMRLLFMQVLDEGEQSCFRKVSLIRMPLRLGTEAFLDRRLEPRTEQRLIKSLHAFRLLLEAWEPVAWRACATSALRSLKHGRDLLGRIRAEAGLELELISGKQEARLLLNNQPEGSVLDLGSRLYVDVGGGSTEVTLLEGGKPIASRSFAVGTVRLLTGTTDPLALPEMERWIRMTCAGRHPVAVGSGGNVNKLISLLGLDKGEALDRAAFSEWKLRVEALDLGERIRTLGLRPDRADVLPHALDLYHRCMEAGGADKMLVPRAGLADAIVRDLHAAATDGHQD